MIVVGDIPINLIGIRWRRQGGRSFRHHYPLLGVPDTTALVCWRPLVLGILEVPTAKALPPLGHSWADALGSSGRRQPELPL